MTIVEEMRAAETETESTPKSAKTITIKREPEPYSKTKVAFRAYYDDGSPMYLGAETLAGVVERVRLDHPGHKIIEPDGSLAQEGAGAHYTETVRDARGYGKGELTRTGPKAWDARRFPFDRQEFDNEKEARAWILSEPKPPKKKQARSAKETHAAANYLSRTGGALPFVKENPVKTSKLALDPRILGTPEAASELAAGKLTLADVEAVLAKLRVKSGLHGESREIYSPWRVGFFYERKEKTFELHLSFGHHTKQIALPKEAVETRGRSFAGPPGGWMADNTWRLTPAAVAQQAAGIFAAIQATEQKRTPVAQESTPAPKLPDCEPNLRVEKDVERFKICDAMAQRIGPLKSAREVDTLVGPYLRRQDQEVFVLVVCDVRFKYRGHAEIHRGERSRVTVSTEDVTSAITKFQGERVFVVHNHPSGDPTPSPADVKLTKTLRTGLTGMPNVLLVDHVVVGLTESYSIEEKKSFKAA